MMNFVFQCYTTFLGMIYPILTCVDPYSECGSSSTKLLNTDAISGILSFSQASSRKRSDIRRSGEKAERSSLTELKNKNLDNLKRESMVVSEELEMFQRKV